MPRPFEIFTKAFPLLVLAGLAAHPDHASAASFDCGRAAAPVEKLICGNPELSALDRSLASAFAGARARAAPSAEDVLVRAQRYWLARRLLDCKIPTDGTVLGDTTPTTNCLMTLYRERIAELNATTLPDADHRHFELAMSRNDAVCNPLLDFYRKVAAELLKDRDEPWEEIHSDLLSRLGFALTPEATLPDVTQTAISQILSDWNGVGDHEFVSADILQRGTPQVVAIADETDLTHNAPFLPGPPFAAVLTLSPSTDPNLAKQSDGAGAISLALLVWPPGYYVSRPERLNWFPRGRYDLVERNDLIDILSQHARLFLVQQGNNYYWIEREVEIDGEIRVFQIKDKRPAPVFQIPAPVRQTKNNRPLQIAVSDDVCYLSPNVFPAEEK